MTRPTSTCQSVEPGHRRRRRRRPMTCTPVGGQGEAVGVEAREALLLVAVGVEPLAEVALGVEQADRDERNAEIGCRLEVVAGEDAEASAVLRQRLGEAELGREVGDELERRSRAVAWNQRGSVVASCKALGRGVGQRGDRRRRRRARPIAMRLDPSDQAQRIVPARLPQCRIEPGEQRLRARDPTSSGCWWPAWPEPTRRVGIAGTTLNWRTARIRARLVGCVWSPPGQIGARCCSAALGLPVDAEGGRSDRIPRVPAGEQRRRLRAHRRRQRPGRLSTSSMQSARSLWLPGSNSTPAPVPSTISASPPVRATMVGAPAAMPFERDDAERLVQRRDHDAAGALQQARSSSSGTKPAR